MPAPHPAPDPDLLLVNAPHFNMVYPPAGIAYICEAARQAGFTPAVIDLNIELITRYRNSGAERYWRGGPDGKAMAHWWHGAGFSEVAQVFADELDEAVDRIVASPAPVIGFSVNLYNVRASDLLARRLRRRAPERTIVYGGWSCYSEGRCRGLSSQPDYICVGESEQTAPALLRALAAGRDPGKVPGVMEVRRGFGRFTPRPPAEDLDRLAWPRWRELDLPSYVTVDPYSVLSVNGSRGCSWGRCHFCSDRTTSPGYRRRSARSIFDEIAWNRRNSGVRDFHFSDLILNGDPVELEALCDLLIAAELDIAFTGQVWAHKRLTRALFDKLRAAGMPIINFGLESGADRTLGLMRKGFNVRVAERCLARASAAGITTDINLMVGFPGETMAEVRETGEFLERNRSNIDIVEVVNVCGVQVGSNIWRHPERFGVEAAMEAGEFESRTWVSADGENTPQERARRVSWLSRRAADLGIGKGYTSREFTFLPSAHKAFNPALYQIVVREGVARAQALSGAARVLVLRSCGVEQAEVLLDQLHRSLPGAAIELLCQDDVADRLSRRLEPWRKLFTYPGGPLSGAQVPAAVRTEIQQQGYQAVVVPIGLMPAETYGHVMALARSFGREVATIQLSGAVGMEQGAPPPAQAKPCRELLAAG